MRLTREVAGVSFKTLLVCLPIVILAWHQQCYGNSKSIKTEPVEWLTKKRVHFKRIIPDQNIIAHYRLKNITDLPIFLVAEQMPPECHIQKMKLEPIFPSEITDIELTCKFPKKDSYRDTGFNLVVIHNGEQPRYRLGISGAINFDGTFNEYADQTYRKYENTMTVHIRRPPSDINWSASPKKILMDLANNQYFEKSRSNMPIGHVTIELNCTDKFQNKVRRVGGQGAKNLNDFSNKILKEGYGFSVLIQPKDQKDQLSHYPAVMVDGRFEYEDKVSSNNDTGIWEPDLMGFATFLVQSDECINMVKYFDDYVFQTQNTTDKGANQYGFGADPSKFEGAGCATFVEEFFKRTSISFYPNFFYQTVHVPKSLFGNPDLGYSVNPTDLILSDTILNKATATSIQLSFPDPNVLYRVVKTATYNKVISNGMRLLERGQFGDSRAIYSVFDTQECNRDLCI